MPINNAIQRIEHMPMLTRAAVIEVPTDAEDRRVTLVFSTEDARVERWFGIEILGHNADEVDLTRLASGTAALLVDHDFRDQVGVIESAALDGTKGRATVRFGNSARAQEILQDVKDRIRLNVSVGYFVNRVEMITAGKGDELSTYRVTSWEPYEISIVSVPADIHAGIGRESSPHQRPVTFLEPTPQPPTQNRGIIMPEALPTPNDTTAPAPVTQRSQPPAPDAAAIRHDVMAQERARMKAINDLARAHKARLPDVMDMAQRHIESGATPDDFTRALLDEIASVDSKAVRHADVDARIGLSEQEAQRFSIMRAIESVVENDRSIAPFEREVIKATRDKFHDKKFRGAIQIPVDVLQARSPELARAAGRRAQQRGMTTGASGAGAELVGTFHDAANFIDLLRNRMLTPQLGVRIISGLVGNLALPKMTSGATAYWIAEGEDVTGSTPGTGQVTLTPHTIAANVDLSRRSIQQSTPDIEAWVMDEMALRLALGMDAAIYNGSGVGPEPLGIINTTGVGSVTVSGSIDFADVIELEGDVDTANALMGSLHYVTTIAQRSTMKQTLKSTGVAGYIWEDGEVNGYPAHATNQMPTGKTIFGNWSDCIVGEWGVLDINIDTASLSLSGGIRLVAMEDCDIALRHAESFSVAE